MGGKRLDCWPLSKLATTLSLSLCPYARWFSAITTPLAHHSLRGPFPESEKHKLAQTLQGLRAMPPIYVPLTDTAANSTVTINPGLFCLRLNKSTHFWLWRFPGPKRVAMSDFHNHPIDLSAIVGPCLLLSASTAVFLQFLPDHSKSVGPCALFTGLLRSLPWKHFATFQTLHACFCFSCACTWLHCYSIDR